MRRQRLWLWLGLLIVCMRVHAEDLNNILVMEMADAPGKIDQQKLQESMFWAVQELHVERQALPLIAVFHVSLSAAERFGIRGTSLWRNRGDSKRYELWIVGEPSNSIYSQMAVSILERHFALRVDGARRASAIRAVCSRLNFTFSAREVTSIAYAWR